MDDITLLLLFGVTIAIVSVIIFFTMNYFFNTRISVIEKSSDTISQISQGIINQSNNFTEIINSNLNTLQNNINSQLRELRQMQNDLQSTQTKTQHSFDTFVNLVKMRPQTKGEIGEGIVRWILDSLPQNSWKEQVVISGGRVDFVVYLPPNQDKILIDSKFSFPESMLETENLIAADKKTIQQINRDTIKRGTELGKYITPENTNIGFILMYVPDIIFPYITEETFKKLTKEKVIPVNISGLLSTILIISQQIQAFKIGEAIKRLESIKSTFDHEIDSMQKLTKTGKKQLKNALQNIDKIERQLEESRITIFKEFGLIEETKN